MSPRWTSLLLIALVLGGCAASRPVGAPPMSPDAANGQAIVTTIGTPFHALFKATACLVSAVVAVPSAAALALTDRQDRVDEQAALYAGLGRNCYGSYALAPI
jgi:hypothetical protein